MASYKAPSAMATLIGLILLADRVTKWWALDTLRFEPAYDPIPSILRFTYVENRGLAFGLFQNNAKLFAALSTIIIVVILWRSWRWLLGAGWLAQLSAALIVAGGVGNIIDRVRYGFVVDFIHLIPLPIFHVFNIADVAISFGAVLLFIVFWREERAQRQAEAAKASEAP